MRIFAYNVIKTHVEKPILRDFVIKYLPTAAKFATAVIFLLL